MVAIGVGVIVLGGQRNEGPSGKGKDSNPQQTAAKGNTNGDQPQILIDEDFRTAYEKKLTIPSGWESDAFRIVKVSDQFGLQVSKPTGMQTVKVPLTAPIRGNFFIEGGYILKHDVRGGADHIFTISLENRNKSVLLPIVFIWDGRILIEKDTRLAPMGYTAQLPTHFLIKREGKKLRVLLNQEPAADKDLGNAVDFDTLRIGLMAGQQIGSLATLFGLKVGNLPP